MLENNLIKLRALEPEDIEVLYKWENDINLWHLSSTLKPLSKYVLEQYILNSHLDIYEHRQLRLMVELKKQNEAIGCIDMYDFDPSNMRAGIGLFISEKYRNKGFAFDALEIIINYAKNILNLHQLYCSVITDNNASKKVFEKAGFVSTGVKLEWTRNNNEYKDEVFYQLILT